MTTRWRKESVSQQKLMKIVRRKQMMDITPRWRQIKKAICLDSRSSARKFFGTKLERCSRKRNERK